MFFWSTALSTAPLFAVSYGVASVSRHDQSSPPRPLDERGHDERGGHHDQLTLTLFATHADSKGYGRLGSLMDSLRSYMEPRSVREQLVVVPDSEANLWSRRDDRLFRAAWPVVIVLESTLMQTPRATLERLLPQGETKGAGGRGAGYRLQVRHIVTTGHVINVLVYACAGAVY